MSLDVTRPRVGCMNWSHPDTPKAIVFVPTRMGEQDAIFDTWAEAIDFANRYAVLWQRRQEARP